MKLWRVGDFTEFYDVRSVSYTHLDVYKRQHEHGWRPGTRSSAGTTTKTRIQESEI